MTHTEKIQTLEEIRKDVGAQYARAISFLKTWAEQDAEGLAYLEEVRRKYDRRLTCLDLVIDDYARASP